jgi:hypothetical protein
MKAFPVVIDRATQIANETNFAVQEEGMDLRDYFASKAMPIILEWYKDSYFKPEQEWVIAKAAYQMADAMIEARNKN